MGKLGRRHRDSALDRRFRRVPVLYSFYMSEFLPRDRSYGALSAVMLLLA